MERRRRDEHEASLPPELREYLEELYHRAWETYIEAGSPFGESDDAMIIWYEFDRQTRRN
ncbi:MAG: hypothetical protein AAGI71_08700 [Bacteroidota bacterium]